MRKLKFKDHAKILLQGLCRAAWGSVTTAIIIAAIWALTRIPAEGGYTAVLDFVAAAVGLVVAGLSLYVLGALYVRRNGGKRNGQE